MDKLDIMTAITAYKMGVDAANTHNEALKSKCKPYQRRAVLELDSFISVDGAMWNDGGKIRVLTTSAYGERQRLGNPGLALEVWASYNTLLSRAFTDGFRAQCTLLTVDCDLLP